MHKWQIMGPWNVGESYVGKKPAKAALLCRNCDTAIGFSLMWPTYSRVMDEGGLKAAVAGSEPCEAASA